MRKLLILVACFIVLQSCDTENGWDCIQTVGDIVEVPMPVSSFSKITVEDDIFLDIEYGDVQQVILTTGSNLLSDITITVEGDGTLRLKNNNSCNLIREHDVTRVKVITPILTDIRSASINPVTSTNTLRYELLRLWSNTNAGVIDPGNSGDFILDIEVDMLNVTANGLSVFTIEGSATNARISFLTELPKFEGSNLIIQELRVLQVSNRDMIVNPQQSITGSIRSTGDVISLNEPPIVEVEELFTGRLLFQ